MWKKQGEKVTVYSRHTLAAPYLFSHTHKARRDIWPDFLHASITSAGPRHHKTSIYIIQEVEVFIGGEWISARRKITQHKCCRKQFHTSESRIAKFLRKKKNTLKAPHKIIAATPIWESESEFTKFMRTSTQIISVLE